MAIHHIQVEVVSTSIEHALCLNTGELATTFGQWNEGILESYLIEITAEIFKVADPDTGSPMVDVILDTAGQKGTGKWTIMNAVENAVVISTINAAVEEHRRRTTD